MSVSLCSMVPPSGKRTTKVSHAPLSGPRYLAGPGAKASAELVGPLVRGFENDAPALSPHQDLAMPCEAAFLWKADGLACAVLEQFRASRFHKVSLDASPDMVKIGSQT